MSNLDTLRPNRGGRPYGAKDRVPRASKASVKAAILRVCKANPKILDDAILKGLTAKPREAFPFTQMAAHYVDGKPADTLKVDGQIAVGVGWLSAPPHALEGARLQLESPVIEAKVLELASDNKADGQQD